MQRDNKSIATCPLIWEIYFMWAKNISRLTILGILPVVSLAHHTVGANFDPNITAELEGEITNIFWRNPHVTFTLTTTDNSGAKAKWNLETHSLSIMRRMDVTEPFVEVGNQVKVAGWPARREKGMFVNNMLLPSGEEFVFTFSPKPADLRWSDRLWGTNERWFAESGNTSEAERGIFRVWSTTFAAKAHTSPREAVRQGFFWLPDYPLTPKARALQAAFDPTTEDPLLDCALKGMPGIMGAPYPLEFVDQGDTIELHIEEYDTIRTIYMSDKTTVVPTPSILGHSTGHWDDETLIVETSHTNWGHFKGEGIRTSSAIKFVERFTARENGSRLEYQLTVTDPATFTEPVELRKAWVWLPDVKVEPYDCATG